MRNMVGRLVVGLALVALAASVSMANISFYGTVQYSNGQPRSGVKVKIDCGAGVTEGCTNSSGYFDVSPNACQDGHIYYYVTICGETRSYTVGSGSYNTGTWTHDGGCLGCGGGGPSGCFLAGTEITLADGSTMPIEKIREGARVLAYDESQRRTTASSVSHVFECRDEPGYLVINEEIRVTRSHPFLSDGQWVEAGQLQVGQTLTDADGNPVEITSVRTVKEAAKVYNFSVDGLETYVAAGVVVHNKRPPSIADEPIDP